MKTKSPLEQYRSILTTIVCCERPWYGHKFKWHTIREPKSQSLEIVNYFIYNEISITPMNVIKDLRSQFPIHQFKFKSKKA